MTTNDPRRRTFSIIMKAFHYIIKNRNAVDFVQDDSQGSLIRFSCQKKGDDYLHNRASAKGFGGQKPSTVFETDPNSLLQRFSGCLSKQKVPSAESTYH